MAVVQHLGVGTPALDHGMNYLIYWRQARSLPKGISKFHDFRSLGLVLADDAKMHRIKASP